MPQYQKNAAAINGATRIFALAGNPVAHSLSPVFWNAALRYSEINAVYVPFKVDEDNVTKAFDGLEALNVCGCNVTRPLKRKVAEYCRFLHGAAIATGAVNTVRFGATGCEGWNTDATGLQRILSRQNIPKGRALVLGNGASAQTALWALTAENFSQVFQIARNFAPKKESGKNVIELNWKDKNFAYAIKESDIIINTTPLGWSPEDFLPEFDKYLEKKQTFVDFNYASASKLIASAHQVGCTVIDGRELLLEQGLESFELLTGVKAPVEVIRNCIYS